MNVQVYILIAGLINGVAIGSVYAIIALGLTLVFGVTRTYNFAHGSFITWGAYIVFFLPVWLNIELSYPMRFAIFIPIMFLFGWIFEKIVIRPIRQAENWLILVMITTLAATLILNSSALVLFGPLHKSLPPLIEGTIDLGGFVIATNDLMILLISTGIITALSAFLKYTRHGTAMRAVAQDLTGSKMVGIYVDKTFGYSLGISAVLAGIAGVLIAPKYHISPMGGWLPFVKSFIIVFLGGLGSFKGTVMAAYILGITESVVMMYISPVWVMPVWFVLLITILIVRPKGLFGIWD